MKDSPIPQPADLQPAVLAAPLVLFFGNIFGVWLLKL